MNFDECKCCFEACVVNSGNQNRFELVYGLRVSARGEFVGSNEADLHQLKNVLLQRFD